MNWMRRKEQPRLRAMALASTVLPVPGTSSISRWPWHRSATRASRTSWCLPTITRSTLARTLSPVSWIFVISLSRGAARHGGCAPPGPCVRGCAGRGGPVVSGIVRRSRRHGSDGPVLPHSVTGPKWFTLFVRFEAPTRRPTGHRSEHRRRAAQPRNRVSPPTHTVITQPMAPIAARNGSPPAQAATRDPRTARPGRGRSPPARSARPSGVASGPRRPASASALGPAVGMAVAGRGRQRTNPSQGASP